jgi:hypothetical protein
MAEFKGFDFKQSNKAEIGINQKGRIDTATLIVSLDGSGDFETIQDAIDNMPTTGGLIKIKEGTYYIDTTLTITTAGIALIGSGLQTTLQAVTGLSTILEIGALGTKIEALNFGGLGGEDIDGIKFTSLKEYVTIKNCNFAGLRRCIDFQGDYCQIQSNLFQWCDEGVRITNGNYSNINDNVYEYFSEFARDGKFIVVADAPTNIAIKGNVGNPLEFYTGTSGASRISIVGNCGATTSTISIAEDNAILTGNITGNVTLESTSSNCVVVGNHTQSITDNGTSNTIANNE